MVIETLVVVDVAPGAGAGSTVNFREDPLTALAAVTDAEASHFILGMIAVQDCRHHTTYHPLRN